LPRTSYSALLGSLTRGDPGGVFFISGDEEYLKDEAANRIVEAFLDAGTRDFNFDQLRGPDVTPESLASVLATPPMMAEHRVVVLREAQGLSQKSREAVEAIAASSPEGLVLVVVATIPAGSRAKFYSTLQKLARSLEFGRIDPVDLPGWVLERAREGHGLEMEPAAARALAGAAAGQHRILASELQKLASYVGERRQISAEDVRAVGGYIPTVDRWAWFDLVAERRIEDAVRQLPALLESGENGVGLVIGIAGQLLRVAIAVAGGKDALEKQLKPYQRWLAGRIQPMARRWAAAEIDLAITEVLRTDRLLKTASLTDRQALEELLLRLASIGRADPPRPVAVSDGRSYLPAR
jgi:DNA polymerase-3 subunit delta